MNISLSSWFGWQDRYLELSKSNRNLKYTLDQDLLICYPVIINFMMAYLAQLIEWTLEGSEEESMYYIFWKTLRRDLFI